MISCVLFITYFVIFVSALSGTSKMSLVELVPRTILSTTTFSNWLFAEALVLAVIKNDYKINISKEKFIQEKIALWNSETLVEPFKYKTTDYNTVATRVDFVEKLIRG